MGGVAGTSSQQRGLEPADIVEEVQRNDDDDDDEEWDDDDDEHDHVEATQPVVVSVLAPVLPKSSQSEDEDLMDLEAGNKSEQHDDDPIDKNLYQTRSAPPLADEQMNSIDLLATAGEEVIVNDYADNDDDGSAPLAEARGEHIDILAPPAPIVPAGADGPVAGVGNDDVDEEPTDWNDNDVVLEEPSTGISELDSNYAIHNGNTDGDDEGHEDSAKHDNRRGMGVAGTSSQQRGLEPADIVEEVQRNDDDDDDEEWDDDEEYDYVEATHERGNMEANGIEFGDNDNEHVEKSEITFDDSNRSSADLRGDKVDSLDATDEILEGHPKEDDDSEWEDDEMEGKNGEWEDEDELDDRKEGQQSSLNDESGTMKDASREDDSSIISRNDVEVPILDDLRHGDADDEEWKDENEDRVEKDVRYLSGEINKSENKE